MQLILWLALSTASATEVVWLAPPSSEFDRDRVADQAGAAGMALEPLDLRAAATRWTEADDDAYATLEAALADVREYETRLDGELVIMRDLADPIAAISVIRDESDRDELFAALAYQGFAVDRYFDTLLAEDPEAADWRVDFDGTVLERPWVDAVAIEPGRDVTAYDIAEAPQRVAYSKVAEVVNGALPASVTPVGLPSSAVLEVDGRPVKVGPAGNFKLPPGRHIAHLQLEGRILARWDFRVGPGDTHDLVLEFTEEDWQSFLADLRPGSDVPGALHPAIEALGGEVWLARPTDKDPEVLALTSEGLAPVKLERIATSDPNKEDGPLALVAGVQGGWFYGGDFLLQAPQVDDPNDGSIVNAGTVSALAAADLDIRGFHVSAGVQAWLPFGEDHFAKTGDGQMRLRPYPHIGLGIQYVQATVGFLFPYHPAVGARAAIPLVAPFELHASGLYGFPGELSYPGAPNADAYESSDVRTVTGGLGLRF